MNSIKKPITTLEDRQVAVQAKLAAVWISIMFLYAYVDIIAFFKPGVIDNILVGKVWEFDVSQTLLSTFLVLTAIPIFMVVLSMTLPVRANRITDLIVASVQIPYNDLSDGERLILRVPPAQTLFGVCQEGVFKMSFSYTVHEHAS